MRSPLRARTAATKRPICAPQGKFEYFSCDPVVLDTETLGWYTPRVAIGKGPEPRAYHSTTRVGSSLFVFGGQTQKRPGTSGVLGDLVAFDMVKMAWGKKEARGKPPRPRYWHAAALVGTKLILHGGSDGKKSLSDSNVLDTDTLVWSQPATLGTPPPPLSSHTCTAVGDRLYYFGGMTITLDDAGASFIEYSSDMHVLDTMSMRWERLRRRGTQPAGRGYHQSLLVGGYVLVLGGWGGGAQSLGEVTATPIACTPRRRGVRGAIAPSHRRSLLPRGRCRHSRSRGSARGTRSKCPGRRRLRSTATRPHSSVTRRSSSLAGGTASRRSIRSACSTPLSYDQPRPHSAPTLPRTAGVRGAPGPRPTSGPRRRYDALWSD